MDLKQILRREAKRLENINRWGRKALQLGKYVEAHTQILITAREIFPEAKEFRIRTVKEKRMKKLVDITYCKIENVIFGSYIKSGLVSLYERCEKCGKVFTFSECLSRRSIRRFYAINKKILCYECKREAKREMDILDKKIIKRHDKLVKKREKEDG